VLQAYFDLLAQRCGEDSMLAAIINDLLRCGSHGYIASVHRRAQAHPLCIWAPGP
jgi:hypothetical protein